MTLRAWTIWTPGGGWHDLLRGPPDITIYYIYAVALMVIDEKIF